MLRVPTLDRWAADPEQDLLRLRWLAGNPVHLKAFAAMTSPCNRLLRACFVALCLAMVSQGAVAALNDCSGPLPITVNIPNVAVPSSLPVGQVIPGARGSFAIPVNCVNGVPSAGSRWNLTESTAAPFSLVLGFTDVYTRSGMNAGLGFRLRDSNGNVLVPFDYQGGSRTTFDLGPARTGANTLQGSFELVKTASTIAPGSGGFSLQAHVPQQVWANGGNGPTSAIALAYAIQPTTVASCSVTQSNITVPMPTVSRSSLPGIGATSGGVRFNIALNCESGSNLRISMTDATLPSNQTTTLTLAAASTAVGIGVQMLYGAELVKYGPAPYSYTGPVPSTNSINLGVRSGTVQIPFQARYIRTGSTLGAGTVQALSTFMLSYQ